MKDLSQPNLLSRRSFVSTALAALGLATQPGCVRAWAGSRPRVALQLYSVRDVIAEVGLPAVLDELRKMGYEGIEMSGYFTKGCKSLTAAEVRRILDGSGLAVCGAHVARDALLPENIGKTIDFNLAYGNSYIVCGGGGMRPGGDWKGTSDSWWEMIVAFYSDVAARAAASGCRIGIHNHSWEFQTKRSDGTAVWDYIFSNTPKCICMEQDVGWTTAAGCDPCGLYAKYPHRSPSLHAKENGCLFDAENKRVWAEDFDGVLGRPGRFRDGRAVKGVDWDALFPVADADGVERYVVECEANPGTLNAARGSIGFLRAKGRC